MYPGELHKHLQKHTHTHTLIISAHYDSNVTASDYEWRLKHPGMRGPSVAVPTNTASYSLDMTLRHKHWHLGMLSPSLTYSKPLTFAEMIPDLVDMGVVVKRTSEMRLHFLAHCLSITTGPTLHSDSYCTQHNVHTSLQGLMHCAALPASSSHKFYVSLAGLILEPFTSTLLQTLSYISLALWFTHVHTHFHNPNI